MRSGKTFWSGVALLPTVLTLIALAGSSLPAGSASTAPITITPVMPTNNGTCSPDARGMVTFWVQATAKAGLRSVTLVMPDGITTTTVYPSNATTITVRCGWYAKNAPKNQLYKATCRVIDKATPNCNMTSQDICVTLK